MKRILSIDGGGIRSLIPALVLAEIETHTGKSAAQAFDLIAGTSTCGTLAPGFAIGDGNCWSRNIAPALADGGYVRLQTSLTEASGDMDNASNGNIQPLRGEAKKLICTHEPELEAACVAGFRSKHHASA
ncbi:hypothetical protein [Chitinolyticbacter albus]|uniref:hypothetical protein n=1 Tax=Chitinolyticbacter albus TaxID=2961951 RepID=UPI0021086A7B|nr:hypothetical protein [Chitinolyticbacter albus]